ncbi:MAG: malate synthase A [Gammaproteobacteria bacterium]
MSSQAEVRTESCAVARITATPPPGTAELFDQRLLALLGALGAGYRGEVDALIQKRVDRQRRFDAGELPDFREDTADIRDGEWRVAPIPSDLQDRRVEITGPVDRNMVVNALNSGARVYMADFEDSTTPTWSNLLHGQRNLRDAVRRKIDFTTPDGRDYALCNDPAVLCVRPRGLHLDEAHVEVDGARMPAAIFDATVFLYHNARALIDQGSGPYLYLPKLEGAAEAALWEQVLTDIEAALELDPGSVKVTVLIETITAVFEMDEILHALKGRAVGLNCGRWDYIFSYIKRLRGHPDRLLPDREQVTMTTPFLRAYSQLLIQTCHRRGAFAMGGMAAQIPVKDDAAANAAALEKVRQDKEREAKDGHDGTWVAHPALVPVAMEVFDKTLDGPNQLQRLRDDVAIGAAQLLDAPNGSITEAGVRDNIVVAIQYLATWLEGQGCVPLNNLMEDAATAEIARAQLWQWARNENAYLDDGQKITLDLLDAWQREEVAAMDGHAESVARAAKILSDVTHDDVFVEFLTLPGYEEIIRHGV